MTSLTVERLGKDLTALEDALLAAQLPIDDLQEPDRLFFRFKEDADLVAFAGLEGRGPNRLIRSIVVVEERRNSGLGRDIISSLETLAQDIGVSTLHLLTTDAAPFFAHLGYAVCDRAAAPAAITMSREFAGLCPASATYMVKELRR